MGEPQRVHCRGLEHLQPGHLQLLPLVGGVGGEVEPLPGGDPRVGGGGAVDQEVEEETPGQPSAARHVEGQRPAAVQPGLTEPGGDGEGEDGGGGVAGVGQRHEGGPLLGAAPDAEQVVEAGEGQTTSQALQAELYKVSSSQYLTWRILTASTR